MADVRVMHILFEFGALPDKTITRAMWEQHTGTMFVRIDERNIPEGHTLQEIMAHECAHAYVAAKERAREREAQNNAANVAEDYVINSLLLPSKLPRG